METTLMLGFIAVGSSMMFLFLSAIRTITIRKIYKILLGKQAIKAPVYEQRKQMIPPLKKYKRDIEEELGEIPEPVYESEATPQQYNQNLRLARQKEELEREYNEKLARIR